MIKVQYKFSDSAGKLIKAKRGFDEQREYFSWRAQMTKGSVAKGRMFEVTSVKEVKNG